MSSLICDDPDPQHVHDDDKCCECGGQHCCGWTGCPVQVGMNPNATVMVSLGFIKPPDAREPVMAMLRVHDNQSDSLLCDPYLTPEQFTALLSGTVLPAVPRWGPS